jgi:hypothetical protein
VIICWQYTGADGVSLDPATGDLLIARPEGVTLREKSPVAWQTHAGVQTLVSVGYQIASNGRIQ